MVGMSSNTLNGSRIRVAGIWLGLLLLISLAALPSGTSVASHPPEYELLESFGPDGSSSSSFETASSAAFDQGDELVYVLDDTAGILYKFDSDGNPVDWGGSASYITDHEIGGLTFPASAGWEQQVAVDSISHRVYVTDANSLRAFLPNGEPAEFTAGLGMGTSTIGGFSRIGGIAVDVHGYLYVSDTEAEVVKVFEPSGEQVNEFPAAEPANLAVDSNGAVYVVDRRSNSVLKYEASALLPVTEETTYSAAPEPVDAASSFSVGVNPATSDVYISKTGLSPGILVYDSSGEFVTSFGQAGSEGELAEARGLAVDGGSTRVYVANWGSDGVSQVKVFKLKPPLPPGEPTIEDLGVRDVGTSSATLRARINPNSLATSYHFEYGLSDCAVSACVSVPVNPADMGSDHDPVAVSQHIAGLSAATTYHYRVVAENSLGKTTKSGIFRTQGGGLGFQLIDRRVWEMVTPPDKHGALVIAGLANSHIQAAADGNGFTYPTVGSIEEIPEGSRSEASAVLAGRDEGGWSSRDISPPNSRVVPLSIGQNTEYKLFDADLSEALLEPRDGTSLSPEASERTPYWRQNTEPPVYRPLLTGKEGFANVPPDVKFGGKTAAAVSEVPIRTATPDLDHVVLVSSVPGLTSGAPTGVAYKWFDGQLEAVSVLPSADNDLIVQGIAGSGGRSMRHAISDDGTRVFWTSISPRHLYVRDTVADETARLDVLSGGSGAGASDPVFQGASADGSVVFFTDGAQLTADASPSGSDLYRCELPLTGPPEGCASLVNISAPLASSGESAEVLGVVSALSEDGTKVYFVARGELDMEPNQVGDFAVSGEPNLYVWQEGESARFVAALSGRDAADWGAVPGQEPGVALLSAVGSPSGRYLAFMSERSLAGEGHLDAAWEPVERVFRYDALTERLDCISCDPTEAGPTGAVVDADERGFIDPRSQWSGRLVAAVVPQPPVLGLADARIPLYRTRAVHDNGRVYFNAIDALVPADSNGEWDVYQHEPNGVGTCTSSVSDADTSETAGGCVSLISSGTADGPAGFLDASVGGDNVFFLTGARLSVLDSDEQNDIYDARVDGVKATIETPVECLGEACQAPPVVPSDLTPGASTFHGPGNLKSKPTKRCAKGKRKVKRNGKVRCVPRKSRKSQNRRPRPGQDRGAAR